MPLPIQVGRMAQYLLAIWSVLRVTVTALLRGLDLTVEYFEERSGWEARMTFCFKAPLVLMFLIAANDSRDFRYLALTALATAVAYAMLAQAFFRRDKAFPLRKPHLRRRFLLMLSIGNCLICHEEARNSVLLSCGHLYCARCIMKFVEQKRARCPYCRRIPESADNLRLERVSTAHLALSIVLALQLCTKLYINGMDAAIMDPSTHPQSFPIMHLLFVCFARWYLDGDWWKHVVTFFRDDSERERRKERQRKDLQWAEKLRDQLEVGLSWKLLITHGLLGFGWLNGVEEWEERRRLEAERMVCPCGCA